MLKQSMNVSYGNFDADPTSHNDNPTTLWTPKLLNQSHKREGKLLIKTDPYPSGRCQRSLTHHDLPTPKTISFVFFSNTPFIYGTWYGHSCNVLEKFFILVLQVYEQNNDPLNQIHSLLIGPRLEIDQNNEKVST